MSTATTQPTIPPRARLARRSQAERSEAMRRRLLAATLQSLAEYGYAGSTLSSIVRRAGVSRGAQVHHYPNKQALMLDAAEDLMRSTYRTLGPLLLSIADVDDRRRALLDVVWDQLFSTPMFRAYLELMVESQRDPALAKALRALLARARGLFEPAVDHYFEAVPASGANAQALFLQLVCLLVGLASQAHLLADPAYIRSQFQLWLRQTKPLLRARKGVLTPPPRPPSWDR